MSQTSFDNRVAQIEAKHAQNAPRRRGRSTKYYLLVVWSGFFLLTFGFWQTGAFAPQQVAAVFPALGERTTGFSTAFNKSTATPIKERSDGARWSSAGSSTRSSSGFFSLSTKGSFTNRSTNGNFVDYIDLQKDRKKRSQNGDRLGFEGQNAHADRRRDNFFHR